MKFDTIIIGGGLSGLTCGIRLASAGRHVAIVSRGQSSLFFSEGSFGLLGFGPDGRELAVPSQAMAELPPEHPYTRMGTERVLRYAAEAQQMLQAAGLEVQGSGEANHQRTTPMGTQMPVWLTIGTQTDSADKAVLFANGRSVQQALQRRFESLGGTFLLGDEVVAPIGWDTADGQTLLRGVTTKNLSQEPLEAHTFVLAAGTFYSGGLMADYYRIYEPVFGLEVDAPASRCEWISDEAFDPQPFMSIGVATDDQWHAMRQGAAVANLYAIGSILGGHDPIQMADKEGVDMATALCVADTILSDDYE